jgi:hypothetical protein
MVAELFTLMDVADCQIFLRLGVFTPKIARNQLLNKEKVFLPGAGLYWHRACDIKVRRQQKGA